MEQRPIFPVSDKWWVAKDYKVDNEGWIQPVEGQTFPDDFTEYNPLNPETRFKGKSCTETPDDPKKQAPHTHLHSIDFENATKRKDLADDVLEFVHLWGLLGTAFQSEDYRRKFPVKSPRMTLADTRIPLSNWRSLLVPEVDYGKQSRISISGETYFRYSFRKEPSDIKDIETMREHYRERIGSNTNLYDPVRQTVYRYSFTDHGKKFKDNFTAGGSKALYSVTPKLKTDETGQVELSYRFTSLLDVCYIKTALEREAGTLKRCPECRGLFRLPQQSQRGRNPTYCPRPGYYTSESPKKSKCAERSRKRKKRHKESFQSFLSERATKDYIQYLKNQAGEVPHPKDLLQDIQDREYQIDRQLYEWMVQWREKIDRRSSRKHDHHLENWPAWEDFSNELKTESIVMETSS